MYKHQSPRTAKKGQIKLIADIGAKYAALRVLVLLAFLVATHVVGSVLFWTPLVGLFLAVLVGAVGWLVAIGGVVTLIIYCIGGIAITTDGIYGRDARGKKFDLCFDQIQRFEQNGHRINMDADVITERGDVRRREYVLHVSNVEEIMQVYDNR